MSSSKARKAAVDIEECVVDGIDLSRIFLTDEEIAERKKKQEEEKIAQERKLRKEEAEKEREARIAQTAAEAAAQAVEERIAPTPVVIVPKSRRVISGIWSTVKWLVGTFLICVLGTIVVTLILNQNLTLYGAIELLIERLTGVVESIQGLF